MYLIKIFFAYKKEIGNTFALFIFLIVYPARNRKVKFLFTLSFQDLSVNKLISFQQNVMIILFPIKGSPIHENEMNIHRHTY